MKLDRDAIESWLAHPVTEEMLKRCDSLASDAREEWMMISWNGGSAEGIMLARLRGRAEAFQQIRDIEGILSDDE